MAEEGLNLNIGCNSQSLHTDQDHAARACLGDRVLMRPLVIGCS